MLKVQIIDFTWHDCSICLQYRLVVKTSLKLLLVFVEYTDTNAALLYQASCTVDKEQGNCSTQFALENMFQSLFFQTRHVKIVSITQLMHFRLVCNALSNHNG